MQQTIDKSRRYGVTATWVHEVEIYRTDGGTDFPVIGAVRAGDVWRLSRWTDTGKHMHKAASSELDLIDMDGAPADDHNTPTRSRETLVYQLRGVNPNPAINHPHMVRAFADAAVVIESHGMSQITGFSEADLTHFSLGLTTTGYMAALARDAILFIRADAAKVQHIGDAVGPVGDIANA